MTPPLPPRDSSVVGSVCLVGSVWLVQVAALLTRAGFKLLTVCGSTHCAPP